MAADTILVFAIRIIKTTIIILMPIVCVNEEIECRQFMNIFLTYSVRVNSNVLKCSKEALRFVD